MADEISEALCAAMMHGTAAMVLSDPLLPDCPLVAVNPAFTRVTGYAAEEAVGRNCRFLQGSGTDPETARRIRSSLQAGQGCVEWIVNHRKDGSAFWNLLFISPVRDTDGTLRYFFASQLDITRGMPERFTELRFGNAHFDPGLEAEFHSVLEEAQDAERAHSLDRLVAAAHRMAEIMAQLAPGTLTGIS